MMLSSILKILLFIPILLLGDEGASDYNEIEDAAVYPVLSPALAKRETSKLILNNNMQVYVISDPGVQQSAAGVCVEAGSWHDPKEYPGMAHFLEHMLFMGTAAYPEETEYMQYITDHGGKVNASTWPDRTIYMFSINNDAFSGALDRFSHFFIDPLFLTSCIERELHAVDQEHAKNVENDGWRQYMVFKETGNPLHPNAGFSTGNAKTLGGIPQEALKNWYQSHYSAEKMHLIVISPLPMDELKPLVVKTFATVPKRELQTHAFPDLLSSPQQRGHMIFLKPIKDLRTLSLMWEVDPTFVDWERQPTAMISYILNDEGEHSLVEQLKREKLAESVSANHDLHGKGKLLFSIDIRLTPQGVSQTETVITRVFQTLAKLREGIPAYLFDEMKKMAVLNYQYESREDAFSFISRQAHDIYDEELATYPEKMRIPSSFDPAFLLSFVRHLSPEKCIYIFEVDPEKIALSLDHKEKWMGAEYTVRPIPREKLALWAKIAPHPQIALPEPNPFLPDVASFTPAVQEVDESRVTPSLLVDDAWGKVYWAEDHTYLVPEVFASFSLKTPLVDGSSKAECCGDLYIKALNEKLSSVLSFAERAGMSSHFVFEDLKFNVQLYGYYFKAPLLLKELLSNLRDVNPTREQFELFKQSLISSYENSSKELPVVQASELLDSILYNDAPTSSEKVAALRSLAYEEFIAFCKVLFKTSYTEGLVYGNMLASQVTDLWEEMKEWSAPLPVAEQHKAQLLLLPEARGPYLIAESTPRQGNGVMLLVEQGAFTFERRASQEILAKVLQESFFDTLRTKQQTSYIARAWALEKHRQLFQFFAVQSSTHHPSDLIGRFEFFLEDFLHKLPTLFSQSRFEEMRAMHIDTLKMPPENLLSMGKRLTQLSFDYDGDFAWIDRKIEAAAQLSYGKIVAFAKESLSRSNLKRLAILVEGVTNREHDFHYQRTSKQDICDLGRNAER